MTQGPCMFWQTCIILTYSAISLVFDYSHFLPLISFSYVNFFAAFTFYEVNYVRYIFNFLLFFINIKIFQFMAIFERKIYLKFLKKNIYLQFFWSTSDFFRKLLDVRKCTFFIIFIIIF